MRDQGSSPRRCCEGGSVTLPLSPDLRARLGAVIQEARRVAESGAGEVLAALAVGDARPFDSMSLGEKALRNALRARGRQAGDRMVPSSDTQQTHHLAHEAAYEHWHRMLFARFLAVVAKDVVHRHSWSRLSGGWSPIAV